MHEQTVRMDKFWKRAQKNEAAGTFTKVSRDVSGNWKLSGPVTLTGAKNIWKKQPNFLYTTGFRLAGTQADLATYLSSEFPGQDALISSVIQNAFSSQNYNSEAAQQYYSLMVQQAGLNQNVNLQSDGSRTFRQNTELEVNKYRTGKATAQAGKAVFTLDKLLGMLEMIKLGQFRYESTGGRARPGTPGVPSTPAAGRATPRRGGGTRGNAESVLARHNAAATAGRWFNVTKFGAPGKGDYAGALSVKNKTVSGLVLPGTRAFFSNTDAGRAGATRFATRVLGMSDAQAQQAVASAVTQASGVSQPIQPAVVPGTPAPAASPPAAVPVAAAFGQRAAAAQRFSGQAPVLSAGQLAQQAGGLPLGSAPPLGASGGAF